MSRTLLRGRTLTFHREPMGPDDTGAYTYEEDGALLIEAGRILDAGPFETLDATDAQVIDHRPHLILPGFIDTHLHFPQTQVIASWAAELLGWLNTYTFPAEAAFSDPAHGARIARAFFDQLAAHGTTTAMAYCSVHPESVDAYFTEAARRNACAIGGKVMMDRNAPPSVLDTAQSSFDDSTALIARWHGVGRARYAISPRFAITSTPAQLEAARALVADNPSCYMQTHLSESAAEIELTLELYPEDVDYTEIYERYQLLTPMSNLGHCIHLSPRERGVLAETGAVATFCPTSNLFLGSGLYDEAALARDGVRRAIATDIGGGTNWSMLRTLDEGYKVLQLRDQQMPPLKSFWWITRGNADALSLSDEIGTLAPGTAADIAVLDARATPAMALRADTITTLAEELFLLQTLGDDRAVAQTYIWGAPQKS